MKRAAAAPFQIAPTRQPDPVLAVLIDIRDELRAIRAAVERKPALSRKDREALADVLPAIAGAMRPESFTLHQLAALESAALRIVFARVNKERLGKLLSKASKTTMPIAGYVVELMGSENNAAIWRVSAVVES